MLASALLHIDEVVVRIDVVQPAYRQQALHNPDMLARQLGQLNRQFFLPNGMPRSTRSKWFVSFDTSGSPS
jgi:hypothetical protein